MLIDPYEQTKQAKQPVIRMMFDFLDILPHDIHVFRFCPTIFERVNFDNTNNMNMNVPQCSSVMSRMAYNKVYVNNLKENRRLSQLLELTLCILIRMSFYRFDNQCFPLYNA